MGLTRKSVGKDANDGGINIKKKSEGDIIVALAGNPNVGKSTVFNALTGMNQHTGNWTGKTVSNAFGECVRNDKRYIFVDIPGTYSLLANSSEEVMARNFICFGGSDLCVVVCDATLLERNLNLVLQVMETGAKVVLCLNLIDEAKKKHIGIDAEKLSKRLGIPVVPTVARKKRTLSELIDTIDRTRQEKLTPYRVLYSADTEERIAKISEQLQVKDCGGLGSRWLALQLLSPDESLISELKARLGEDFFDTDLEGAVKEAREGISEEKIKEEIVSSLVLSAESICSECVTYENQDYKARDLKVDRILTGRFTAYPFMILLLALVFWLTVSGANYPSELLGKAFFSFGDIMYSFLEGMGAPTVLCECLINGIYRVLAWVVSVMLPPMAIFFPLFTLLEDCGYLPRVAYNLDRPFRACRACGKQALTMCMGFGCNAAGVVGCRIIDSPRERLLAILTNSFVPCNGRFPALISVLTMFFAFDASSSLVSALLLTLVIILGVLATLLATFLLSKTLLRGLPSSFTLEMPPFRAPQVGKVIVRSVFDRTLLVLGRAIVFSAPAGLIIWCLASFTVNDLSLLSHISGFLDPFASLLGLDGVILLAFILALPANEIVIPIIIMSYLSGTAIVEMESISEMRELFTANGWTWVTAVSFVLFSLFHWPCSTTLMTIKKETGSLKWTFVAVLLPTAVGVSVCMLFNFFANLFVN